jgi:hypothetical protein
MTSPRQRKKRLAFMKMKENLEQKAVSDHKPVVEQKQVQEQKTQPEKTVAPTTTPVVESEVVQKPKKPKAGLVELKSQEQVVEQVKEEVKTPTKE